MLLLLLLLLLHRIAAGSSPSPSSSRLSEFWVHRLRWGHAGTGYRHHWTGTRRGQLLLLLLLLLLLHLLGLLFVEGLSPLVLLLLFGLLVCLWCGVKSKKRKRKGTNSCKG